MWKPWICWQFTDQWWWHGWDEQRIVTETESLFLFAECTHKQSNLKYQHKVNVTHIFAIGIKRIKNYFAFSHVCPYNSSFQDHRMVVRKETVLSSTERWLLRPFWWVLLFNCNTWGSVVYLNLTSSQIRLSLDVAEQFPRSFQDFITFCVLFDGILHWTYCNVHTIKIKDKNSNKAHFWTESLNTVVYNIHNSCVLCLLFLQWIIFH